MKERVLTWGKVCFMPERATALSRSRLAAEVVVLLTTPRQIAANSRRWWKNSGYLLNSVLTNALFEDLGMPKLV